MTIGCNSEEVIRDLIMGSFGVVEKEKNHTGLGFRENRKRTRGSVYRQLLQLVLLKREQKLEVIVGRGHGVERMIFFFF